MRYFVNGLLVPEEPSSTLGIVSDLSEKAVINKTQLVSNLSNRRQATVIKDLYLLESGQQQVHDI